MPPTGPLCHKSVTRKVVTIGRLIGSGKGTVMGRILKLGVALAVVAVVLIVVHEGLRLTAQGEGDMAGHAASTCAACHGG
jgi:cytochrome c553